MQAELSPQTPKQSLTDINKSLLKAVKKGDLQSVINLINTNSYNLTITTNTIAELKRPISNKSDKKIGRLQAHLVTFKVDYDSHLEDQTTTTDDTLDFNTRDANGCTPLHWAAALGYTAIVNLFIAIHKHHLECVSLNPLDNENCTPLHRAVMFHGTENVRLLNVRLLIAANTNLNVRDNEGRTPLHHAARLGNFKIVTLLINAQAAIDTVDNKNTSPLLSATFNGFFNIANHLKTVSPCLLPNHCEWRYRHLYAL